MVHVDPETHQADGSDPRAQLLVQLMLMGDPDCSISVGSDVVKSFSEEGDITKVGTKGVVKGSVMMEGREAYLVNFEGQPAEAFTFITREKIEPVK